MLKQFASLCSFLTSLIGYAKPSDESSESGRMKSSTPFKTLVEKANDFDLVDGTFVKIDDHYSHSVDTSKYTPVESVIMLVWHSAGIIDNGGFEHLFSANFENDPDFMSDEYSANL